MQSEVESIKYQVKRGKKKFGRSENKETTLKYLGNLSFLVV